MRSIAASTRLRTPSSKVRTLSLMIASSGMTFSFVPACSDTDCHDSGFSRPQSHGRQWFADGARSLQPLRQDRYWPEASIRERLVRTFESAGYRAAEVMTPTRPRITPAGLTMTCCPSTTSGFGKRLKSHRQSSPERPPPSPLLVGRQASESPAMHHGFVRTRRRRRSSQVTCMSWPRRASQARFFPRDRSRWRCWHRAARSLP